jgi:hypothetical protein
MSRAVAEVAATAMMRLMITMSSLTRGHRCDARTALGVHGAPDCDHEGSSNLLYLSL